nr:hypothetical protein HanIR_Chr14g0671871 [Helianthus annuus]KAJ0654661.1 hypothetical protein HanLR1_Chr14g0509691 [Helianthus annuus]KAJ0838529.1 hypothetical protein HanPSC8_Chr14g0595911 [Helianthus annuus]
MNWPGICLSSVKLFMTVAVNRVMEYEFLEFAIVKAVGKLSRKTDAVETLKKVFGEQDVEAGDVVPATKFD